MLMLKAEKHLDVALNITGVKKVTRKLVVAVDIETLEAIRFELCMSGALD